MAYKKVVFVDGTTPLNANNFNHIEEGLIQIESDTTFVSERVSTLEQTLNTNVATISSRIAAGEQDASDRMNASDSEILSLQNETVTIIDRIDAINTSVSGLQANVDGGTF